MHGEKKIWEEQYSKMKNIWGFTPNETLVRYKELVSKEGKILDLGMGEGRNALYFASNGYETEGIDLSEIAVERCRSYAHELGISMKAEVMDLSTFHIEPNTYSLIILSNVLNFFHDKDINAIISKVKNGLIDGGLVYINGFNVHDPSYKRNIDKSQRLTEFTFYRPKTDTYIHYFTKNQLEDYFKNYTIINVNQSYLLDLGHGDPHYHGTIEWLAQNLLEERFK